jgi:hypothetical protein
LDALVGAAVPAIARGDEQPAVPRLFRIVDETGEVREIGARGSAQGFADGGRKQPVPDDRNPQAAQNLGAVAVTGLGPGVVNHASAQC